MSSVISRTLDLSLKTLKILSRGCQPDSEQQARSSNHTTRNMKKISCFRYSSSMVNRLETQLRKRKDTGKLRALQPLNNGIPLIDFSSNDYLGLSRSAKLNDIIDEDWKSYKLKQPPGTPHLGSTGSRLLTGNSAAYQETEKYLASFHGHSQCLLANSGWDLNYGLLSCIPCNNTVVFYDELSHNSLIMGLQSGRGLRNVSFKHNDMNELRNRLSDLSKHDEESSREKLIVVESIYSMDGDTCPIIELLEIAKEFNAMVVVDEAHSTGIVGSRGEGLVSSLNLQSHQNLLGVVHTFGKGVGLHGAALLTSHESLIGTLLNYCKPLIYSTSLPVSSVLAIRAAYTEMESSSHLREKLIDLTTIFRDECEKLSLNILPSRSPIQGILIPTNAAVMAAASTVKDLGYTCLPIRAPTVPEGSERLRIILHAHNSEEEVIGLCAAIKESLDRLH